MKTVLRLSFFALMVSLTHVAGAQSIPHRIAPRPSSGPMEASTATSTSGTGQNIDVVFHRADWNIDPRLAKSIAGSVTTYFKTRVANVSVITFDFRKSSFGTSTSVKYHGATVTSSFPATGAANVNVLSITLPAPLAIDVLDSVTITYSGTPPAEAGYAYGYQRSTAAPWSIATLSESHEDKDWWPCKADMQDKVDSMRINVTVPWVTPTDTFWVASNGVLIDSAISGTGAAATRKFQYLTNYPMASYLVAISVSKYTRYYRQAVNINGTDVPVVYYLFPRTGTNPHATFLSHLDKSRTQLVNFSSKFGDYPFKKEKHGYYEYISTGMEHQTFSGMSTGNISSWSTIAHELVHQWFGDKVTFATWSDVWLAEGFAKYGEILALELDPSISTTTYTTHRANNKTEARQVTSVPVYIPAATATSTDAIFGGLYSGAIYNKGGMVVSMLRRLVGDDLFYQALTNYMNDPLLAYKSATTDDLKRHFEQVTGHDFDPFFNSWIYGKGHCDYTVKWGNTDNRINIELSAQINRTTDATPAYFHTPVVLRIAGTSKDTTVVIYDENGMVSYAGAGIQASRSGKRLAYKLSFVPTSVTIDPFNETMILRATATNDPALNNVALVLLGVDVVSFTGSIEGSDNFLSIKLSSDAPLVTATMERSENGTTYYQQDAMMPISHVNGTYSFGFRDGAVAPGRPYYYRVKIVDEKGAVSYSKIVRLEQAAEGSGVRISPNPVRKTMQVSIPEAWRNGAVLVQVHNAAGVVVTSKTVRAPGHSITMNLPLLSSGTYTLKVAGADDKQVTKTFSIIQ